LPSAGKFRESEITVAPMPASTYDGCSAVELERRLGVPRVVVFDDVASTLDIAHALAADGAPAGTLVVADAQTAGRGRHGRAWHSARGAGVWLTLVERLHGGVGEASAVEVLSLRVGLALAPALEPFSDLALRLKWPNDVYAGDRKLAGVLAEARWRDGAPEWIAIGVGINVRAPAGSGLESRATGLREGVARVDVLAACVAAVRSAAACRGPLTDAERSAFAARDLAAGRDCVEPVAGCVRGIDDSGALLVDVASPDGQVRMVAVRSGSLVLTEER
jgi:BirA family transcriptional regulator, biotin operon repressor / biotin---[acetyl-CoA-carboxylase] ligase